MLLCYSSRRKLIQNGNLMTSMASTINRWTAIVPNEFSDLMFPLYLTCSAINFDYKGDISPWLIRKLLLLSFQILSNIKELNVKRPVYKLCINSPNTPAISDQGMCIKVNLKFTLLRLLLLWTSVTNSKIPICPQTKPSHQVPVPSSYKHVHSSFSYSFLPFFFKQVPSGPPTSTVSPPESNQNLPSPLLSLSLPFSKSLPLSSGFTSHWHSSYPGPQNRSNAKNGFHFSHLTALPPPQPSVLLLMSLP